MKKIYILIVLVVQIFLSFGCSNKSKNWITIEISDVGSFKLPTNIACTQENEVVYLTIQNHGYIDYSEKVMIGIIYENNIPLEVLSDVLGKKIIYKECILSETFSNSAIVGKNVYIIDGVESEKIFLELYSSNKKLFFVAYDNQIDYNVVKEIGKTFVMHADN